MASLVSEVTKKEPREHLPTDSPVENTIDIPKYSQKYNNLTKQEKKIFGNIFCICLSKSIRDDVDKKYCNETLKNICGFLELDDNDFLSIEPMLVEENNLTPEPFLQSLNKEKKQSYARYFIVSFLRFLFLANEGYDARIRAALFYLCKKVPISEVFLVECENQFCEVLLSNKGVETLSEDSKIQERKEKLTSSWNLKRGVLAGGAAIFGGAALVLTGGLAAPAVAAGFSALGSI